MQDQLVKKLKDSLNKSSESYQHISNQSQGGLNNLSLNFNSNMNQNNTSGELPNQSNYAGNYLSNKLKKISQGAVNQGSNETNKQKADKPSSVTGNYQDSSNLNLTNKITSNIREYYNQNGQQAQDVSSSQDQINKFQQYQASQKSVTQGDRDYSDDADQNYNECQRLDTELIGDEGDDEEEDTELIIQKEFVALMEHERLQQENKLFKKSKGQQSSSCLSEEQQAIQEQIYQQHLLIQQQQLAGLQPGDFRIEIENRFLKSDCNSNFKFPRKLDREKRLKYDYSTENQSSNDSSLLSVDEITVYNLHAQNMKNYQREYMQMQEEVNDQMEKFKAQEQLRLQKEEEEIIEKERLQHQLRQQKMIQQQVYVQHQYEKYSQEKKNEQIQQLRDQLQKQQTAILQIKQTGNPDSSQIIKTEAYDSESMGRSTLTQYGKNQNQSQQIKNNIEQYSQINQQLEDQNIHPNNTNNSQKKAQVLQQQQQLLQQGMKQSLSAEKQNSKQQQQLQKFKNMLINKQQNQSQNKGNQNGNARRMKTEGNDIDGDQLNQYNHHHHLHTQNRYHNDDIEEDETIENFEDALQDGSDNDSGEIARLDDIKIQSYKQTASPPKNTKSINQQNNKSQIYNQENSSSKKYKNIMEILEKNEKNFKNSHSRQSTSISNSNQVGSSIGNNMSMNGQNNNQHQKKSSSQHSSLQTVQIQIQQAAVAAAAATTTSLQKNSTYKSRPTTSQSNHYKNLYSSQNCSINQQSSNRNTIQGPENNNISKLRQSSKTSHTRYEGNSTNISVSGHAKKSSGTNLNQSIEGFSIKQQSQNQTHTNQFLQAQSNSRKRSISNKNNNSISVSSSIPTNKQLTHTQNSQKQNLSNVTNYSKQLDNFKIDNLKTTAIKPREEKAPSKAPTCQQYIMNLLSSGSFINNNNANNSFQITKNMSMNQGNSNKMNSQNFQNSSKIKGRNANSFHQNAQSSNISSIHTSQTTNINNKSTIVSNYSINSNSKKKLLSSSSSSNLINGHSNINNTIKNDPKIKQQAPSNQISSIINANININNLNPTNYSKVRISTNSNVRDSIQSQKGNGLNSRVQTEPSGNDEEYDINYLHTRLSTLTKIPSKQTLLNNKSTTRRKDNSGSKSNLRDQLFQQQQPNSMMQKQQQQQIGQSQALQNLMINNAYNNMKTEENLIQQNQHIPSNQVKYSENQVVKTLPNQPPQIHSNLRSTNEQSTSDLNDQNKLNGQSFDQIQKIRDYLKQKSAKYPIKQQSQVQNSQNQFQMSNGGNQAIQYTQQQGAYKELYPNNNVQQTQLVNPNQQQQQLQSYQNFNQKPENQIYNQYNSQFNSSVVGQQPQHNNQNYFQKQIR